MTNSTRLKCTPFSIGAESVRPERGSTVSVQFGRWNFDGKPVDRECLEKTRASIAPYGPDDTGSYSKGNISILYRAFHTTKESRRETQPHVMSSGAVLPWDGRWDNRPELARQFTHYLLILSTASPSCTTAYPNA